MSTQPESPEELCADLAATTKHVLELAEKLHPFLSADAYNEIYNAGCGLKMALYSRSVRSRLAPREQP